MIDPLPIKLLVISVALSIAVNLHSSEAIQCPVPNTPEVYAIRTVAQKWGIEGVDYHEYIVQKESGGNPLAQNPTSSAFGMYQFLDSTWELVDCEKTVDPYVQIDCGIKYIEDRYGNVETAYLFHKKNNWY